MTAPSGPDDLAGLAPDDPRIRPVDLHLDRAKGFRVRWADGLECVYPLAYLRKHCPCATCRTEREQQASRPVGTSLPILPAGISRAAEVTDAGLVGAYAVQIKWGDGHDTGIYDFRYLRSIAPPAETEGR